MKSLSIPFVRGVGALLLTTALLAHAAPSSAAGNRLLTLSDCFAVAAVDNGSAAFDVVAGVHYVHPLVMEVSFSAFSLNTQAFPGYTAVSFDVGVTDNTVYGAHPEMLVVTADGAVIRTEPKKQGELATKVIVPFGKAKVLHFSLSQTSTGGLILGNPTLEASAVTGAPAPALTTGGPTSIQLGAATVSAGGQESAQVTTRPGASVIVVVTFPDGTQEAIGPQRAGASGHTTFTWPIPSGISGTGRVVVVSTGVAQGSFVIQ